MYGLKGGTVAIPRWILAFRALQLLLAILVLALTSYSLSVYSGGPLKPALISTLIIAILTIIPILVLTTPLHLALRRIYDPRIALLLDLFALLYWLATFSVLASYHHVYRSYGRNYFLYGSSVFNDDEDVCRDCRSSWRAGVATTVFAGLEFLLFLLTTLIFIYYYHHHLAGTRAPGLPPPRGAVPHHEHGLNKTSGAGLTTAGADTDYGTAATHPTSGALGGYQAPTSTPTTTDTKYNPAAGVEQHQLSSLAPAAATHNSAGGLAETALHGNPSHPSAVGNAGMNIGGTTAISGLHASPPYPIEGPRAPGANTGYLHGAAEPGTIGNADADVQPSFQNVNVASK